jgi:hypothetical protein
MPLINDDAGAAVENLLDADTQRLTNAETARTTEDEKHTHLRLDGRRVGKMVHHFNREALTALFLLDDLWDDQAHLFPITWVDFLAVLIDAGRKHHLHHLEVILDGLRPQPTQNHLVDEFLRDRFFDGCKREVPEKGPVDGGVALVVSFTAWSHFHRHETVALWQIANSHSIQ